MLDTRCIIKNVPDISIHVLTSKSIAIITAGQLRAARALLGIDQRTLARLAGVSLPTVQRMEASKGNVRCVVETLTKIVAALDNEGIELIGENATTLSSGRGVRLKTAKQPG